MQDVTQQSNSEDPSKSGTNLVAAQAGPLSPLIDLAKLIYKNASAEPTFKPNVGEEEGIVLHKTDLAEVMGAISRTSTALLSASRFVHTLNQLGRENSERTTALGSDLIPIAVDHINQRQILENRTKEQGKSNLRQLGQPRTIQPDEMRLLKLYAKSHEGKVKLPEWYTTTKFTFAPTGSCGKLPGPEAYIEKSAKLRTTLAGDLKELADLKEKKKELERQRNSQDGGPGGDATLRVIKQHDDLADELDRKLSEAGDVDPSLVPECCKAVQVAFKLENNVINSLANLHNSIEQVICRLAGVDVGDTTPIPVECAEVVGQKQHQTLSKFALDGSPLLATEQKVETLATLLSIYCDIRREFITIFEDQLEQKASQPGANSNADIYDALRHIFSQDGSKAINCFTKLGEINNDLIKASVNELLVSKILVHERGSFDFKYNIHLQENVPLLGQAVGIVLRGSNEEVAQVEQILMEGETRPQCVLGLQVRELLQKQNIGELARFFQEQLNHAATAKFPTFTDGATLINVLAKAGDDEIVRIGLKGRLKVTELVDKVAERINEKIRGEKTGQGQYIESLRAMIAKRYAPNLSDYWGQKALVDQWKQHIEETILLLKHPEAWEGIPSNQVFYNGFFLYGVPGAGKSFLAECMANEYGLSLLKLSREEMAAAYKKAASGDEEKIETTLSQFLEEKIKIAKDNQAKSGASACMILIDEMEAEFLKRDPQISVREELIKTNIMLRVIEGAIKNNREVIFVSASNHKDQVDSAALRTGRFGIHMKLELPKKEDVIDIMQGNLARLEMKLTDQIKNSENFSAMIESCVGMIPLDIVLSINHAAALHRIRSGIRKLTFDDKLIQVFKDSIEHAKTFHSDT